VYGGQFRVQNYMRRIWNKFASEPEDCFLFTSHLVKSLDLVLGSE
jgi:hypothetical protein